MTADDVVTMVTRAATTADALAVVASLPRASVLAVADLVHVAADGHGLPWVRRAIVAEARA
jgi:hypothetical protein